MTSVEKINELLKVRGISANKLMGDIGFSSGLFSQWKKGLQKPSVDKLSKIADYFGVSVNDLLETSEAGPARPAAEQDFIMTVKSRPELQLLIETTKNSTNTEIKTYIRVIKALQEREE